jgi:hypothetical protein
MDIDLPSTSRQALGRYGIEYSILGRRIDQFAVGSKGLEVRRRGIIKPPLLAAYYAIVFIIPPLSRLLEGSN